MYLYDTHFVVLDGCSALDLLFMIYIIAARATISRPKVETPSLGFYIRINYVDLIYLVILLAILLFI